MFASFSLCVLERLCLRGYIRTFCISFLNRYYRLYECDILAWKKVNPGCEKQVDSTGDPFSDKKKQQLSFVIVVVVLVCVLVCVESSAKQCVYIYRTFGCTEERTISPWCFQLQRNNNQSKWRVHLTNILGWFSHSITEQLLNNGSLNMPYSVLL